MISDPLVEAASRLFNTTVKDIRSRSRYDRHVKARQAVCYVLRVRWGARYASIGKAVGYADHSTAHVSTQCAAGLMQSDPGFRRRVLELAKIDVPGGRALRSLSIDNSMVPWAPEEMEAISHD